MNTNMYIKEYQTESPVYFILRDGEDTNERLLFHIKTGDYFAMLATILGFVEEELMAKEYRARPPVELALVREMKKDLIFLNARYDIHEKAKANI